MRTASQLTAKDFPGFRSDTIAEEAGQIICNGDNRGTTLGWWTDD